MKYIYSAVVAIAFALGLSGMAHAQQAFASANTGWSANSSFSTFNGGSHSFGGGVVAFTGSAAQADDGFFFGDTSNAGAYSFSGGFGGGFAGTSSGFSTTSMDFMGVAESGAQASD